MPNPLPLPRAYDAALLRAVALRTKHAGQARRLLALAALYDGATPSQAAAAVGVTLQIIRDWVLKLAAVGPNGLVDRHGGGKCPILTDQHRRALAATVLRNALSKYESQTD